MAKVKWVLGIIVIVALVIGGSAPFLVNSWPAAAQDEKFQLAPLNPDFLDFLEQPPESSCGYVPPTMDLSHLKEIPVQKAQTLLTQQPSSWDWRTQGKVTPVKDQETCGTCWAFGTTSVLESAVLLGESAEYDFSEQSVALCVNRSWVYLYDDADDPCNGGGNSFLASEVFIKKGAVLESCNPYDTSGLQCDGSCACDSCLPVKKVTGYRYVTDDQSQTVLIKAAVYERPVTMSFYYDPSGEYADGTYGAIYDYYPCTEDANHLVSIIGWDDDVPHLNPAHSGAGAWLVKNSWGIGFGNDGYFWLAYDSSSVTEIAYLEYGDYNANETMYYWDEAGFVNASGDVAEPTDTAWMASVFTSEQDGDLTHVDFWTTSNNAAYEIYVYDDSDPSGGLSNLLTSQVGSCAEFGYYSIPLTTPVPVTNGQRFTVAVKMTTPGFNYPLPVEYEIPGTCEPPIQTGVCFVSLDGSDWVDAADYGGNVCLRAKITSPEPPTATNVDVRIEGENDTIWSGSVTVDESWITATNSGVEYHLADPTALGALDEAASEGEFPYETTDEWGSLFVTSIDGKEGEGMAGWLYRVDYISPMFGAADFILNDTSPPDPPHGEVLFYYGEWGAIPLKLEVSNTAPDAGDSFTVTVTGYDDDTDEWLPTEDATIYADTSYTTDENGEVEITIDTNLMVEVYAEKDDYIRSNRVTVTVSPSVSLSEGWNLISLPLIPDDSSIDVVLSGVGDISSVYYWYNDGTSTSWQSYVPGSGGTLTTMEDGKAYFIYMTGADTLTITGSEMPPPGELPPTYDVYVGWNFIGFKSTADMDNTDYLTNIDYSVLWGYEPDEGYFNVHPMNQHPDGGDDPTIGDMEVGYGYWLWATSSGTIVP